jgi:integrase
MGSFYRRKLRPRADGLPREDDYSPVFWCKYYVAGRPVRESTGTTEEREARRFLKIREGAVAVGAPIVPRQDRTTYEDLVTALVEHYTTTGRRQLPEVEDRLHHLNRFFRGWRATAIGPGALTKYVAKRQAELLPSGRPPSPRTINMELSLLRRAFRLGAKHGTVGRVPFFELLKEAPPRQGFLEDHQYAALRRQLPPDLQAVVAVAHLFGWRARSEILTLQRRQLDLGRGILRLDPGATKNDDGRVVYLTEELQHVLREQLARVRDLERRTGRIVPWLFPHLEGHLAGQRRKRFQKAWRTACRRAGVPGAIPHDFRRTAVRNMERAGVPRSVAMKLTGHKTESVYRRYAIVSDADLQEATRRLTDLPPVQEARWEVSTSAE